jgi:hypothetical protein
LVITHNYLDAGHGETPQFKVDSVLTPIISVLLGINRFWRGGNILMIVTKNI